MARLLPQPGPYTRLGRFHSKRYDRATRLPVELVAEVNDTGTEGVGFEEAQVDRFVQQRKHGRTRTQEDRVDEDAVFIDQTGLEERRSKFRAADLKIGAGLRFEPGHLFDGVAPDQLAFPSTCSSVLENTILGFFFQMRENSTSYARLDCVPAEGQ